MPKTKIHKLTNPQKAFIKHAKGLTEYGMSTMTEKGYRYPKVWHDTVKVLVRVGIISVENGCVTEINNN